MFMEMLIDLVLLYGADVWGSCRQLGPIEKIQLRVSRIFLEVGRLHSYKDPFCLS